MPPAVVAGVAIGSAVIGAYGQYKAGQDAKAASKRAADMFSAQNIMGRFRQLNPDLYSAAYGPKIFGQAPTGNFADYLDWQSHQAPKVAANPLAALYQMPGYMDPALMNQGLQQIDESYTRNLVGGGNFAAQMGMLGGMSDMYSFAAAAQRQNARQDVWQNFQQQTEQLRRQDIAQGQEMKNAAMAQASGQAQGQAGYTAQAFNPTNWASQLSQVGSSAITAYGAAGMMGSKAPGAGRATASMGPQRAYQYPTLQFQNQFQAPRKFSGFESFGTSSRGL